MTFKLINTTTTLYTPDISQGLTYYMTFTDKSHRETNHNIIAVINGSEDTRSETITLYESFRPYNQNVKNSSSYLAPVTNYYLNTYCVPLPEHLAMYFNPALFEHLAKRNIAKTEDRKAYFIKPLGSNCYDHTGMTFPRQTPIDFTDFVITELHSTLTFWESLYNYDNLPKVLVFNSDLSLGDIQELFHKFLVKHTLWALDFTITTHWTHY